MDKSVKDITTANVQKALNGIRGKRRTVEITRTALKMCLDRAVKDKMIYFNPVNESVLPVERNTAKAKALSDADDKKLMDMLCKPPRVTANATVDINDMKSQTIRDALYFVRMTGVRREEAVALKWDDVSTDLHIRGSKNRYSDRHIPLLPEVKAVLERRKFRKNSEYVFATSTGRKLDGSNLMRWMALNTDYTVHDLRHTYITRAAQAGINPKILASLTGHSKVETLLDIYTHVTETDKMTGR